MRPSCDSWVTSLFLKGGCVTQPPSKAFSPSLPPVFDLVSVTPSLLILPCGMAWGPLTCCACFRVMTSAAPQGDREPESYLTATTVPTLRDIFVLKSFFTWKVLSTIVQRNIVAFKSVGILSSSMFSNRACCATFLASCPVPKGSSGKWTFVWAPGNECIFLCTEHWETALVVFYLH